jgi:hypothetical protein
MPNHGILTDGNCQFDTWERAKHALKDHIELLLAEVGRNTTGWLWWRISYAQQVDIASGTIRGIEAQTFINTQKAQATTHKRRFRITQWLVELFTEFSALQDLATYYKAYRTLHVIESWQAIQNTDVLNDRLAELKKNVQKLQRKSMKDSLLDVWLACWKTACPNMHSASSAIPNVAFPSSENKTILPPAQQIAVSPNPLQKESSNSPPPFVHVSSSPLHQTQATPQTHATPQKPPPACTTPPLSQPHENCSEKLAILIVNLRTYGIPEAPCHTFHTWAADSLALVQCIQSIKTKLPSIIREHDINHKKSMVEENFKKLATHYKQLAKVYHPDKNLPVGSEKHQHADIAFKWITEYHTRAIAEMNTILSGQSNAFTVQNIDPAFEAWFWERLEKVNLDQAKISRDQAFLRKEFAQRRQELEQLYEKVRDDNKTIHALSKGVDALAEKVQAFGENTQAFVEDTQALAEDTRAAAEAMRVLKKGTNDLNQTHRSLNDRIAILEKKVEERGCCNDRIAILEKKVQERLDAKQHEVSHLTM